MQTSWLYLLLNIVAQLAHALGPWSLFWAFSLSTMELIPHSLTAALSLTGIRSLAKVSNPVGPIAYPVLYLRQETHDAAPKCISGRTSYHGV